MAGKFKLMNIRTESRSGQIAVRRKGKAGTARARVPFRSALFILFLGLCLTVIALAGSEPSSAASDKLPDLGMTKFQKFSIELPGDGRRLLRFAAVIVNIGTGAFEARGTRPNTSTIDMTVAQRIYDTGDGFRDVSTPSTMFFAGDGHKHWHIRNLEHYDLLRTDNGVKVGTSSKSGFCFYDTSTYNLSLPGAPQSPVYTKDATPRACAQGQPDALFALMGLSVGWGDRYGPNLPDQYIDITNLVNGKYRLVGQVDRANWFLEQNENNNCTWTDLQITGSGVTVVANSPDSISCDLSITPTPAPTPTPGAGNLLANPGFELDAENNGKPDGWTRSSTFTRSNVVVHLGSYAGRHSSTADDTYNVTQTVGGLSAGTIYKFSAWVNVPVTSDAFSFTLDVRWFDAAGTALGVSSIKAYTAGTGGWNQATASLVAPSSTASALVRMRVSSLNATIYVDDFSFGP